MLIIRVNHLYATDNEGMCFFDNFIYEERVRGKDFDEMLKTKKKSKKTMILPKIFTKFTEVFYIAETIYNNTNNL